MKKLKFIKMLDMYGVPMWAIDSTPMTDAVVASLAENGTYVPEIEHVTYNSGMKTDESHVDLKTGKTVVDREHQVDVTIVDFVDGTRTVVSCSAHDTPDRQTAITNAIAKRVFGKVNCKGMVEGNGTGVKLRKIADAGFDQTTAEEKIAKAKAAVKAAHDARQKAEHDKAYLKKVKREAEKIALQRAAEAYLEKMGSGMSMLNESGCTCCGGNCEHDAYVRPDKKFKDFTQDEKREYWRWQKRK